MDIIVHVKEAPTGNIQVGGGYGDYNGLSFDASVNDKNIFGSGINAGIKFQTSKYSKATSLNFSNPRLNDSEYSGSMSIFNREFELIDTYRTSSSGVSFSVGKRLTRTLSANVGYS
jgi:outer membrane protein insertion porin family